MIGLRVTVPIACWRKGHAREYLETEALPPPATCYGFLLSLVGEEDRHRHRGVRVTAGLVNSPEISVVLRTLWRVKSLKEAPGVGSNARPDYQQLVVNAELVVWCDSTAEPEPSSGLESRVGLAIREPARIQRFGGLSLGESTHLVNEVVILGKEVPRSRTFLLATEGALTLPVWVDHVGSAQTRFAVGNLEEANAPPTLERVPQIPLS
ncbi:MAG: type I-MYXAN CRISPR-associated protein Cas5/Cmx5/DevS [Polyangia bacterium]|jgi:CRISPR-associated protein Cas5t